MNTDTQMKENLDRAITLLRATKELLSKQKDSPHTLNMLNQTTFYDECDRDGYCLLDDIDALLDLM